MSYKIDDSNLLKNVFKFYKTQSYDSAVLNQIDEALQSLCVTGESCCKLLPESKGDDSDVRNLTQPLWSYLPVEDLFIVRNVLSENTVDQLVCTSLAEWTSCIPKACNLGVQDLSGGIWKNSLTDIGPEYNWNETLLGKLRWITLGYHYDWTNRCYTESDRSDFPPLLANVSKQIVHSLAQELTFGSCRNLEHKEQLCKACSNFEPEAAIVNYYRGKTTMGFHTDEVEFDKCAPLVSISLGPSAIYLLETSTPVQPKPCFPHTSEPSTVIPVVLRHGDVVVMLGRSRLAKHAVPAVLFSSAANGHFVEARNMASRCARRLCPDCSSDSVSISSDYITCSKCTAIAAYLKSTRINMNVRQVLPYGSRFCDFLH